MSYVVFMHNPTRVCVCMCVFVFMHMCVSMGQYLAMSLLCKHLCMGHIVLVNESYCTCE